jgi:integrative and conjugative element protein (TIGR02256 family)
MALVWISKSLIDEMESEARRWAPLETGGVLLGFWSTDEPTAEITAVTGPGPNAVHRRSSFIPDYDYQDREITVAYRRSGRIHSYLGDWHSHPFGSGMLSLSDRRTLQRIATDVGARAPQALMAVLSHKKAWTPHIWMYKPPGSIREKLLMKCDESCALRLIGKSG